MNTDFLNDIKWDANGLVTAIAQDKVSGRILMVAWMNKESLSMSVAKKEAVYWSRSRQKLWHKGEESGHIQKIDDIRLDCDGDVLLLTIEQVGGIACHTGRESCFFRSLHNDQWQTVDDVVKDPSDIYGSKD